MKEMEMEDGALGNPGHSLLPLQSTLLRKTSGQIDSVWFLFGVNTMMVTLQSCSCRLGAAITLVHVFTHTIFFCVSFISKIIPSTSITSLFLDIT